MTSVGLGFGVHGQEHAVADVQACGLHGRAAGCVLFMRRVPHGVEREQEVGTLRQGRHQFVCSDVDTKL